MNDLNSELFDYMVDLLVDLLPDERSRRQLIDYVFMGETSKPDIDVSGAARIASSEIVQQLHRFGALKSGERALVHLLNSLKNEVGTDRAAEIDRYISQLTLERDHIFISYSHADRSFVDRLLKDLDHEGVKVWVDRNGLTPGTENWQVAIKAAIRAATHVVVIISPNIQRSNVALDEIALAKSYKYPILPLWVSGDDDKWHDYAPLGLGQVQYIDARERSYENGLKHVVAIVKGIQTFDAGVYQVAAVPAEDVKNPYKGLKAFTEADADQFFGREALTAQLVEEVQRRTNVKLGAPEIPRLLAVVGPSGSGKSSVVMAGLLPKLKATDFSKSWQYLAPLLPTGHPMEALEDLFVKSKFPQLDAATIRDYLHNPNTRGLTRLAKMIAVQGERVVLFIDQFEEVFMQTTGEDASEQERRHFIDLLASAATQADSPLLIILTMRADFFDRPLQYESIAHLMNTCTRVIEPMSVADLTSAIELPAERSGLVFDRELVPDLVSAVRDREGGLPLLQFALELLFEKRIGNRLTYAAYLAMGGVSGALSRHADETYNNLPDNCKIMARDLFLQLVEPGATADDTTRARLKFSRLERKDEAETKTYLEIAETFVKARLLMTNQIGGSDTIEVSHEALIREWPTLVSWLNEARSDILLRKRLISDAEEWDRLGRPGDLLYTGLRLAEAQVWRERRSPNALESDFIAAAEAAEVAAERAAIARAERELELERRAREAEQDRAERYETAAAKSNRIARIALIGVVAALLLGTIAVGTAVQARRDQETAQIAEAAANNRLAEVDSTVTRVPATLTRAANLVVAGQSTFEQISTALAQGQIAQTQAAVNVAAAQATLAYAQDSSYARQIAAQAFPVLNAQDGNMETAALLGIRALRGSVYTDDADRVVNRALDRLYTLQIYRGENLLGGVNAVAFSPNGQYVLTGHADNMARLWNATTGELVQTYMGHASSVSSVAFSPNGRYVATGSHDTSAMVWDLATGSTIRAFYGHQDAIRSIAYSPDERYIVTGSSDATARLWDIATGNMIREFAGENGHLAAITSVAFSPDGRYIVTGSEDETAVLWDVAAGTTVNDEEGIPIFFDHDGRVNAVAFSPDGQSVLTAGIGGFKIWPIGQGTQSDYQGSDVYSAVFSPDGRSILTGGVDHAAHLWPLNPNSTVGRERVFSGHTGRVNAAVFSPDGHHVLTGSADGSARLWGEPSELVRGISPSPEFDLTDKQVNQVVYSSDGRYLLTTGPGYAAHLYDAASRQLVMSFNNLDTRITSAAINVDNRYVITGDAGDVFSLWDAATGEQVRVLAGSPGSYYDAQNAVAFSPDGQHVLTGSANGVITLWNVSTGTPEAIYGVQILGITDIGFSPDAQRVYAATREGSLQWWETQTGRVIDMPLENDPTGTHAVYDPQRDVLLVGYNNGVTRLWNPTAGSVIQEFTGSGSEVSRTAFSPDGRYVLAVQLGGAHVWDVATGSTLRIVESDSYDILSAVFDPAGDSFITGNTDGTVRWWDIDSDAFRQYACSRLFRDFTEDERRDYEIGDARTCDDVVNAGEVNFSTLPVSTVPIPSWTAIPLPTQTRTPQPPRAAQPGDQTSDLPIGNTHLWAYAGQANETLTITTTADWDTTLEMVDPNGVSIGYSDDNSALDNRLNSRITLLLPATGMYTISVRGYSSSHGGPYTLNLDSQLPGTPTRTPTVTPTATETPTFAPTPSPILIGQAVSGLQSSILPVGGQQTWDYAGRAGETLEFRLLAGWDTTLEILRADGTSLDYNDEDPEIPNHNSRIRLTLPATETYSIVVRGYQNNAGGPYTLTISYAPTPTLTGTPLPPQIAQVGDQIGTLTVGSVNQWTYEGQAGDFLEVYTTSDWDTTLEIFDPAGTSIMFNDDTSDLANSLNSRVQIAALPVTGTYSLIVRGYNDSYGGVYSLTINTVPEDTFPNATLTPVALLDNVGSLVNGVQMGDLPIGTAQTWTYAGTEGEEIDLFTTADWDTVLDIVGPDGTSIGYNDDDPTDELENQLNSRIQVSALPQTGVYTIIVSGYQNANGGSYALTLYGRLPGMPTRTPSPITPTRTPTDLPTLVFGAITATSTP